MSQRNFVEHVSSPSEEDSRVIFQRLNGVVRFKRNSSGLFASVDYYPSDTDFCTPVLVVAPRGFDKDIKPGVPYEVFCKEIRSKGNIKFIVEEVVGIYNPIKDALEEAGIKNLEFFKETTEEGEETLFVRKYEKGRLVFEDIETLETVFPDDVETYTSISKADVEKAMGADQKASDIESVDELMGIVAVLIFAEAFANVKYANKLTPAKIRDDIEDEIGEKTKSVIDKNQNRTVSIIAERLQKHYFGLLKSKRDDSKPTK